MGVGGPLNHHGMVSLVFPETLMHSNLLIHTHTHSLSCSPVHPTPALITVPSRDAQVWNRPRLKHLFYPLGSPDLL